METFITGKGELFQPPDVDGFRSYVREHKPKALVNKVMTEQEAVSKFIQDGDYIAYDMCMMIRGPNSLIREIIRQRKRDLGFCGKFTYATTAMLAGGECLNRVDIGFAGWGLSCIEEGKVRICEWSNSGLTMRLLAGAMGIPFIPARFLAGSFDYSAAKLAQDPFSGVEVVLLPALNPDVGLIHVHQCDIYGNARVLGSTLSAAEVANSSKKVILSTEEIIDNEEIRRHPSKTLIPHYLVDAVVEAPFGSYPGEMPGLYASDQAHIREMMAAIRSRDKSQIKEYLEQYVYNLKSDRELLDKVGASRLLELKRKAIREGYYD